MRSVGVAIGVLGVLVVLGGVKAAQINKLVSSGKKAQAEGPPPEAVATSRATEQTWEATISDVGTVTASKGVTLSSELPGIVTRIYFESGDAVKTGAPIIDLDTNVERSQLGAAVARKDLASLNLKRTDALLSSKSIAQAQYDVDATQLEIARQDVSALRAQIALKQVRAPFEGQLGIRAVNIGQYISAGTPITVLERVKPLFVDFTTPQERLPQISIGMPVRIAVASDEHGAREGRIDAIEPTVDVATRSVRVRATVPNDDGAIRPGMFVRVTVILPQREKVVAVPTSAIMHASFGDSVFVVEDKPPNKIARQQFVKTGETRGDFVAIKDGLVSGQEVVTSGAFKLRAGGRVVVSDTQEPQPKLDPKPSNR